MSDVFILNTSPLIVLGKSDLLKVLSPLAQEWVVPENVISEVEVQRKIDCFLDNLSAKAKVKRVGITRIHSLVAAWDLGVGESEVLSLGLENPGATVVLDDLQARKCASVLGVTLTGTLGLLLMAKRKGYIKSIKLEIAKLIENGIYVSPSLLRRILSKIGEA